MEQMEISQKHLVIVMQQIALFKQWLKYKWVTQ